MPDWYEKVRGRTWIDVFIEVTDHFPERVFARCGNQTLTYGGLRQQVDEFATGLLHIGVRPGETVAVWMTNCLEFLLVQWATYRLGCTLLPLYSYYRSVEIEHGLRDTRASTLLTKRDFAGKVDPIEILLDVLPELGNESPHFSRLPDLRHVVTLEPWDLAGTVALEEISARGRSVEGEGLDWVRARTSPLDVMHVMYTSGTTGVPKGGLSMHGNNMASMHLWGKLARLAPDDVILCHVPLFTNFGALGASALGLYHGTSLVITEYFDPEHSLQLIEDARVTYIPGTPEMFRMILDHPRFPHTDVSTVRSAHVAGSACEPQLMGRIIDELAPEAMQAYGMSECGGLSTATTADDPPWARLETVGRPLANSRVAVFDPETGERVPHGEVGEIWFGDAEPGSCVGKGYLASPETTAAAITPSGWFRSGDLGLFDHGGYLRFIGRIKQMFTVGGFNVYPAEIERHLSALEGIEEAFVVGVPDERLGTVPAAFVVVHDAERRIPQLMDEMQSYLSSQKRPRIIWPIAREDLPMTPSGKVRRTDLEEWAAELWAKQRD